MVDRIDGFARVKDFGPKVRTKYKYAITECRVEGLRTRQDNQRWAEWQVKLLKQITVELQPDVFAEGGIPLTIRQTWGDSAVSPAFWPLPLFYASLTVFPAVMSEAQTNRMEIEVTKLELKSPEAVWGWNKKKALGNLFIPITFLAAKFWDDPPPRTGHENEYLDWECVPHIGEARVDSGDRAQVYAIASLLKQMEDSGEVDAALEKIAAQKREAERRRKAEEEKLRLRQEAEKSIQMTRSGTAGKPPYRIINLAREEGSDFAYTFSLELAENASIQTFFGVQNVFANEVLVAYMMEYPNANSAMLRVLVHPRLEDGRIVGRAEVLTITPVSLSYDAGTRRGKLSVRFNPGQAEEARAWIRKNIETLARDKNIALTTGQLPPAATYYSLGERIDGTVMEIEFKTE